MKIKIEINSQATDEHQNSIIKENIKREIYTHREVLKNMSNELIVRLYDDPLSPLSTSLTGSAFNKNGEEIIKITYSLVPPHTCNYFFLGS